MFSRVQLNSCNSNSYNSNTHLIRTDSVVPSEFTLKTLQENSYNSNPCNSKNHVNRTDFPVQWRNFDHVIRILDFFDADKLDILSIERFQSNVFDVQIIVWQSNVFFFAIDWSSSTAFAFHFWSRQARWEKENIKKSL